MRKSPILFQIAVRVLSLLAFAVLWAGCDKQPGAPVRIGFFIWPGYEPLRLGDEMGYFGDVSIRFVDYGTSTQVLRAFRNGAIDIAAVTLDEALLLAEDIPELRVFLALDYSKGGDAILGQKDIPNMQALKGKRVGYEATALGAYILSRALELNGMNVSDITPISVPINEHERAFHERRVEAIVTFEPMSGRLMEKKANRLFDSTKIPGEVLDVLVSRKAFLDNHLHESMEITRGWYRALKHLSTNPADAYRRMEPRMGVSKTEIQKSFELMELVALEDNKYLFTGQNPLLLSRITSVGSIMLNNKLLRRTPDAALIVDGRVIAQLIATP